MGPSPVSEKNSPLCFLNIAVLVQFLVNCDKNASPIVAVPVDEQDPELEEVSK